jgi:hypothetical protein
LVTLCISIVLGNFSPVCLCNKQVMCLTIQCDCEIIPRVLVHPIRALDLHRGS